jgi:hypothetical protein
MGQSRACRRGVGLDSSKNFKLRTTLAWGLHEVAVDRCRSFAAVQSDIQPRVEVEVSIG